VLVALLAGTPVGFVAPGVGKALKPLPASSRSTRRSWSTTTTTAGDRDHERLVPV
jgi:hypothetical protein